MPDLEQVIESWARYQQDISEIDIEVYEYSPSNTGNVGQYVFFKDGQACSYIQLHFMVYTRKASKPTYAYRRQHKGEKLKRLLEDSTDWAKITPSFETKTAVMVAYDR